MFKKLGKSANFMVNINYVFLNVCLVFGKRKNKKKEKKIGKEGQRGKRKEKDKGKKIK